MEAIGSRRPRWQRVLLNGTLAAIVTASSVSIAHSALTGSSTLAHAGTTGRPNIVLIVTDDQRWNTLWAMPNVRRDLVANGVTFTNAFVTTSLCCPSRASILTGQYSRHTGVYTGVFKGSGGHGGAPSFKDTSTLATWLHAAGYQTALVGKYLNDYNRISDHEPPGWSVGTRSQAGPLRTTSTTTS